LRLPHTIPCTVYRETRSQLEEQIRRLEAKSEARMDQMNANTEAGFQARPQMNKIFVNVIPI
jgi:hypothetical protein